MIVFTSKIINNSNLSREIDAWMNEHEKMKVFTDGFKIESHVFNQESLDIVPCNKR